jgi:hypothetical protein
VAIIENWIKAGAATVVEPVAVSEPPRAPVTIANVIATIHSHCVTLVNDPIEDRVDVALCTGESTDVVFHRSS